MVQRGAAVLTAHADICYSQWMPFSWLQDREDKVSTKSIPKAIRAQVEQIVAQFNQETFPNPARGYQARFRGQFLYLDRCDTGEPFQICRLTYTGKMNDWEFAIFRHSKDRYDPDEWFFPGQAKVDGTIVGAMQAGLLAYPVMQETALMKLFRAIFRYGRPR